MKNKHWYVYILRCSDNTLYTGITKDLKRRLEEHNGLNSLTKYTRARQPVKIVYKKKFKDRSSASMEEAHIKKMSRQEKESLL